MTVKVMRMKDCRDGFKRSLLNALERDAKNRIKDIEDRLRTELGRTFTGFGPSGRSTFADASVSFNKEVDKTSRGVAFSVTATVVYSGSKTPHPEWHIVNFGRAPFVQRNTSPPIQRYSGQRTAVGNLDAGFNQAKDGDFVILAGTQVDGIAARRWYRAAIKRLRSTPLRRKSFNVWRDEIEIEVIGEGSNFF